MGGRSGCESFLTLLTQLPISDHYPAAWPGTGISGEKEQQLQQEQIISTAKDLSQLTLGYKGRCHCCICYYNHVILLQETLFGPNLIHSSQKHIF